MYRDLRLVKRSILAKCSETNNVSSGVVCIDTGRLLTFDHARVVKTINESRTGCTAVITCKDGDAYIEVSWKWEEGKEDDKKSKK